MKAMNPGHPSSRRAFLHRAAAASLAATMIPSWQGGGQTAGSTARKFKLCLVPGSIGVKGSPREIIALAAKHRFEAVEANVSFLCGLSDEELAAVRTDMKTKGLVFGAAGLTVDFRGDEAKFRESLEQFPKTAAGLRRAGVDRVGTWISPTHNELDYGANLRRHAQRLREAAKVLRDHGQRLGLEYVGTPSSRKNRPNPFIHSLRQMQELIAEIGTGNVGVVLDSWHWWTAGETEADLLKLKNTDVVSADLNDAPKGLTVEEQLDGQRELPCATGVIPVKAFLKALQSIGFDGPVRAEPFNKPLNNLENEEACAAVIASLRKAVALLD